MSCDPPNRLLPNELYLPVLVITAHQEQHDKSMSYCTVQSIPASTVQEQTLTGYEIYGMAAVSRQSLCTVALVRNIYNKKEKTLIMSCN